MTVTETSNYILIIRTVHYSLDREYKEQSRYIDMEMIKLF